jgi:hypothetical protein
MNKKIACPVLMIFVSVVVCFLFGDWRPDVVPYTPDSDIECETSQTGVADIIHSRHAPQNISEMHDILMRNGYALRNIFQDVYIYKRLKISNICLFNPNNFHFYLGYGELLYVKIGKDGVAPRAYGSWELLQLMPGGSMAIHRNPQRDSLLDHGPRLLQRGFLVS